MAYKNLNVKRTDIIMISKYSREVNDILNKHPDGGMTFFDIKGRCRAKKRICNRWKRSDGRYTGICMAHIGVPALEKLEDAVGRHVAIKMLTPTRTGS